MIGAVGSSRWRAFASGRVWSSPSDIGDPVGVYDGKRLIPDRFDDATQAFHRQAAR